MTLSRRFGSQAGFGILHLIVSLGVLVATLYFVMKQRAREPEPGVAAMQEAAVTQDVQRKLDEAAQLQEKKMGCAVEEEGCEK